MFDSKLMAEFAAVKHLYPTALDNVECGAQCGPGWVPAVLKAIAVCEAEGVGIVQIKQKFGGLRIYTGKFTEKTDAAIRLAEEVCAKTCEQCGAPGKLRGGVFVRTLCEVCR